MRNEESRHAIPHSAIRNPQSEFALVRRGGRLALTPGDPCGIGPEVLLKAVAGLPRLLRERLIIFGDLAVFEETARRLALSVPRWQVRPARDGWRGLEDAGLVLIDRASRAPFHPGVPSKAAGDAALAYLDGAIALARAGRIAGLVTGPVTKSSIDRPGRPFVGQTEYLAKALGARGAVMAFVSDALRVVLLTRHLAIAHVPKALSRRGLAAALEDTRHWLRTAWGIRSPRIAVCGLNPHAGEASRFGTEEERIMRPVIQAFRRGGLRCEGPFAADGLFGRLAQGSSPPASGRYDAIICPYHDQGLIPFKMLARDRGCQVTIGLPIVRTSPDHGSALDIAGQGGANPGSMRYALMVAARLASVGRGAPR